MYTHILYLHMANVMSTYEMFTLEQVFQNITNLIIKNSVKLVRFVRVNCDV